MRKLVRRVVFKVQSAADWSESDACQVMSGASSFVMQSGDIETWPRQVWSPPLSTVLSARGCVGGLRRRLEGSRLFSSKTKCFHNENTSKKNACPTRKLFQTKASGCLDIIGGFSSVMGLFMWRVCLSP